MELMRRTSAHGIDKRHREHFVGWFERKVSNVVIYMSKNSNCLIYLFELSAGEGSLCGTED